MTATNMCSNFGYARQYEVFHPTPQRRTRSARQLVITFKRRSANTNMPMFLTWCETNAYIEIRLRVNCFVLEYLLYLETRIQE